MKIILIILTFCFISNISNSIPLSELKSSNNLAITNNIQKEFKKVRETNYFDNDFAKFVWKTARENVSETFGTSLYARDRLAEILSKKMYLKYKDKINKFKIICIPSKKYPTTQITIILIIEQCHAWNYKGYNIIRVVIRYNNKYI